MSDKRILELEQRVAILERVINIKFPEFLSYFDYNNGNSVNSISPDVCCICGDNLDIIRPLFCPNEDARVCSIGNCQTVFLYISSNETTWHIFCNGFSSSRRDIIESTKKSIYTKSGL